MFIHYIYIFIHTKCSRKEKKQKKISNNKEMFIVLMTRDAHIKSFNSTVAALHGILSTICTGWCKNVLNFGII